MPFHLFTCLYFFLSSPISPLFGSVLSFLHSVNNWPLLYTVVIDGQAGVQGVRLAGPWEALPQLSVDFWVVVQVCKMRLKSLFGCLTELSFLLYHLVPTTQSRYFSLSFKYILLQYCIDYGWLNMSVAFRVCCYIMHKLCLVVDSDTIFHPIKTWLYSYHKWYDFLKCNFKEWMYIYKKWISILKIHWVMNYNINDFTLAFYFQEVHLKLKFIYY